MKLLLHGLDILKEGKITFVKIIIQTGEHEDLAFFKFRWW
jgi:hypothetical protein